MKHDDKGVSRFSDPAYVEALPYRSHHYWYVLEKCRHIGIQKIKPGHIVWTARILTKDKRYHQKTIGSYVGQNALSYESAVEAARLWFRKPEIAAKASPSAPIGTMKYLMVCPIGDVYTVGHALRDYIEWRKLAGSPRGYYNTLCLVNYHLVPMFSHVPLDDFDGTHLRKLAIKVLETPPKKGTQFPKPSQNINDLSLDELRTRKVTLNSLISILRTAFRQAWESGHTDTERSWRSLRRIPVAHRPRTIFLTREECRHLLSHCKPPLRALALGALYSGCRVGELSKLRVQDVGRQGYGIFVDAFKRGPSRFVFLPDEGMAFFLELCDGRRGHEPVFLSDRGVRWNYQYKSQFKKAVLAAGLPESFVFHGLRHTYASQLVAAGVSLEIIARQLGHANTQTVSRFYGHLAEHFREDEVRRNFTRIETVKAPSPSVRKRLSAIEKEFSRTDWRDYAKIEDQSTLPRRVFARGNTEVIELFHHLEN